MTAEEPYEAEQHRQREWNTEPREASLGTYVEFVVGGLLVAVGFLFTLPILVAVTDPFGMLSTTALVFLFLFAWYAAWLGILLTHQHLPHRVR